MFEAVEGLVEEHARLEEQLGAPETHADQRLAKRLNQRYAELSSVITAWREWNRLGEDVVAARELATPGPRLRRRGRRAGGRGGWPPRSGCAGCWCRATPPTPRTRSSR